jgi:hypothetical protein
MNKMRVRNLKKGSRVRAKKSRLEQAEEKYCFQLHEWLTNPMNDDLPEEVVEANIQKAFDEFLKAMLEDEDECAEFIAKGVIVDEHDFLPLVFEHFRSQKIYEAIKSNCEVAFSHKFIIECEELENQRRAMLEKMKSEL